MSQILWWSRTVETVESKLPLLFATKITNCRIFVLFLVRFFNEGGDYSSTWRVPQREVNVNVITKSVVNRY